MVYTYSADYDLYGHPELRSMGDLLELVEVMLETLNY